MILKHPTSI